MIFKRLLIVLVVLCVNLTTVAQQKPATKDSLSQLRDLAYIHLDSFDHKTAIDFSAKLIATATDQKDTYFTFVGYDILGTIYTEIKDTLQARVSYEKALEIAKESKVDSLLSWAYVSLGNNESDQKVNYQKGIDYYRKSVEINERNNKQQENIIPYMNIGWTYLDEKQEDRALPFLLKAKNLAEQDTISLRMETNIKTLLGRYYLRKKNYTLAEEQLSEAAQIVESNDFPLEASEVYKYYAALASDQKDFERAYAFLEKHKSLEAKRYESDKLAEIQAASAKFNLEQMQRNLTSAQKEQLITDQLVEKSKELNIIFIISSLVLLTALISIFFAFKSRKKYIARLRERNQQLRLAKEDAERLSSLKTQFFSTVSHELRTPLYGVIGIASILLEDDATEAHQDDLKSLKFSADYLLALINDVLLINKMDVNAIKLEHTPFRLSTLIESITRSFEFSLEQNKNTIHIDIHKDLPNKLIGDSVRLSQILMNLIGNAIKFNENGNIWITIDLLKNTAAGHYKTKFTIKDDGIGIPKSKHQSIFEEFSQVQNRNYNYQGTGLGLPIVKKLLALYGSEIKLESKIGEGSTFSFVIDLEANELEKIEMREEVLKSDENGIQSIKDAHVLVVDDNRINQKITQKMLEKRQFQCSLADDGEEAIAMVRANKYDLILMDIHMPKIDGIEATKAIRTFNPQIPIVALTAVELDEMRATIMESGMNDIILKPYDVSRFLTTILRNLNQAKNTSLNANNS